MLLLVLTPVFTINSDVESTRDNTDESSITASAFPVIGPKTIVYDTNGDGKGPYEDDRPLVTVVLTDDGYIDRSGVNYADVGDDKWSWFYLDQNETDESIWYGSFPFLRQGRHIQWFIACSDNENQFTEEWPHVETFTVLNRAPIVELTFPTGGENFTTNTLNITWNGYDLDLFDKVTFDVYYNRNSEGWIVLAENISETYYVWDISEIRYSDSVLIKIVAGDGYITTEVITPYVFIIGTAGFGSFSVLILSLVVLTSIPLYLKKRRRK